MTPLRTPITPAERRYNKCHIKTRNIVERTIGILKSRFGILASKLRYQPYTVGNIVVACCILHNVAILHNEHFDYVPDPQAAELFANIGGDVEGNAYRRVLIENFFHE
jgi:hypothetical protein